MAEIIASTTGAANSADFTLTAGLSATLYLKDADGPSISAGARALVQIKSGAEYFTIGELTHQNPAQVLTAIGTFRVSKLAGAATAFGVDKD